jgi:hypothetical protein
MRDIFRTLDIEVEEVSMSQTEAIEKVRSGEIAATVVIAGKPVRSMSRLGRAGGLHFLAVPFSQPLIADYLPTSLTHDDYPDLIPAGRPVETIAVGVVLITYNWPKTGNDRYQRIEKFVEAFFARIDEFRKPPRHPKWREVNVAATLPGWARFEAAQNWLDTQRVAEGQPRGTLARIMHHSALFCMSARHARADGRSDRTGVPPTHSATRLGLICLARRRIGAQCPAAHPDGARRSAIARNKRASGKLVGNWMRMRAACSITRAPILNRRSRMVANSAFASGSVFGMASRTASISQYAAV